MIVRDGTLTQAAMNRIPVPLPGAAEQQRIVDEVDRRLSLIRGAEAQVEANLKRSDRLRQSILERAFSGQLIPEDQNAGPASELFTRIHVEAEPEKVEKTPKTRAAEPIEKGVTVTELIETLKSAGGWISAQEAFCRCGAGDGADTDKIEQLYAELRDYVRPGIIEVERRGEEDWLRVSHSKGA